MTHIVSGSTYRSPEGSLYFLFHAWISHLRVETAEMHKMDGKGPKKVVLPVIELVKDWTEVSVNGNQQARHYPVTVPE